MHEFRYTADFILATTGRSPLSRWKAALQSAAIEEEEEDHTCQMHLNLKGLFHV